MEKIAWLGAVLAVLAVVVDPLVWGATGAVNGVMACHGLGAVIAVVAALVTRSRLALGLRVGLVLLLVALMQADMTAGVLFLQQNAELVPGLLVFSFFCVLPLAPLISWRTLILVDAGLLLPTLALLAFGLSNGLVRPLQAATVLQFQLPGQIFLSLYIVWIRQQSVESYLLARDDHVHLTLDGLSQVLNRATWLRRATDRLRRDRDARRTATLIMADIDHFKRINDTWGHPAGDEAIRAVAQVMVASTRDADLVGRLGGEEFGIFLPGTDLATGVAVAERIRAGVEALRLVCPVRISLGVAAADPAGGLEHLVSEADRRLYTAKAGGRNRVVSSSGAGAPG